MSKMNDMAMTIEELRNAAAAINDAADWLAQQFGGSPKVAEEPEAPTAPAKPALTLEDVRTVLANKSRAGHTAEIRELLKKYGASKLSLVSETLRSPAQGSGGALICHQKDMHSSPHPLLTDGFTAHRQQGSAKPTRIKVVIMQLKEPMHTLFVSTNSVKLSA